MCELCESGSDIRGVAGEPFDVGEAPEREVTAERLAGAGRSWHPSMGREALGRRALLVRGLVASGIAGIAAPLLSEAMGASASPTSPFETVGLGNDHSLLVVIDPTATPNLSVRPAATSSINRTTSKATISSKSAVTPAVAPAVTGTNPYTIAPDAVGVPWATNVGPINLQAPPAPPIVTRAEWGADESIRTNAGGFAPIRKLVVHHTASPNNPSDPVAVVRQMYDYHVLTRGYDDVGYNFIIDHRGTVYEGRYARAYASGEAHTGEATDGWGVIGGHAKGMNCGACGVVLIGNFVSSRPTAAALHSLVGLLAWKAGRHQIDVTADDVYVPLYGGVIRRTPNLAGHRDIGITACPGGGLYSMLPAIRKQVLALAGNWPALTINNPRVARFFGGGPNPLPVDGGDAQTLVKKTAVSAPSTSNVVGYRVLSSNGTVKSVGGSSAGGPVGSSATSIASAGSGSGYLTLNARGDVYGYAGATVRSSIGGKGPGDAVDLAVTASGNGYWILTSGGGVYHFGDAQDAGSPRRQGINDGRKIAGTPSGAGYWILMNDGSIRNYGDAAALGSPPAKGGTGIDFAATPTGKGYWVLLSNGGVSNFGDAPALGGLAGQAAKSPAGLAATPSGNGYVIVSGDGTLTVFGDAPSKGSLGGSGLKPVGVSVIVS